MKRKLTLIIVLFITAEFNLSAALIQSKKSGNWNSTSTWVGGVLPGIIDDVQINNNDDLTILSGNTYTIAELWMGNGSSLSIDGKLTIDSLHINNNATLNVNGTLIISGGISISNNAGLVVNSTGTVNVQGDLTASNGASLTIDGSVNIEGSVSFSNNGSITIGDTGLLDIAQNLDSGRATINGTGPINVYGTVSGTNSGDSQINSTLPIELLQFNVKCINNQVIISWTTVTEINNDYFTIQRSDDGTNFINIGTLQGAGNSNSLKIYNFIDANPTGSISYYRLMQTDYDGKYKIFKPKAINTSYEEIKLVLQVYPNPANKGDNITIIADGLEKERLSDIVIMDNNGTIIKQLQIRADDFHQTKITFDSSNLEEGMYLIWSQSNNKVVNKKLLIK